MTLPWVFPLTAYVTVTKLTAVGADTCVECDYADVPCRPFRLEGYDLAQADDNVLRGHIVSAVLEQIGDGLEISE